MTGYAGIARDGLWANNPGLVQLLGLCPLLAVSNTVVNGLALGLATLLVLTLSSALVSAVRHWIAPEIRIPIYVLIIAGLVTVVELGMNAWWHGLYLTLGIFIPIITTNCVILGRAEAFAARNPVPRAAFDGFVMGAGFLLVLVLLGALRELLGQGTLFDGLHLLLGEAWRDRHWALLPAPEGLLLAILPPGAFIGLGLLVAGRNWIDQRFARRPAVHAVGLSDAAR